MEENDMARMTCKCGEELSNSSVPNDIQLWVYTDKEMDVILTNDIIEAWKFPSPTYDVWQCPKCRRIYVFEEGVDTAKMIFKPEE